ncbi:MAG: hypothetical protein WD601_10190 [Pseudohongiellaceae bacterium]
MAVLIGCKTGEEYEGLFLSFDQIDAAIARALDDLVGRGILIKS